MPAVALTTTAFARLAAAAARGANLPDVRTVAFPHPLNPLPSPEVERIGQEMLAVVVGELLTAR